MRRHPFVTTLIRWAINALGIFVAANIIPGIECKDSKALWIVVVVLGLFNAFLKPMLVLFALPFIVMTLGAGILFINAFLLMLASQLVKGFTVDSFMAAFFGALVISIVNLLLGRLAGDSVMPAGPQRRQREEAARRKDDDDVIDI